MENNKIGIIVTTFLRDELMYRIVQSIINHWKKEYVLFVGNQSYETDKERLQGFSDFGGKIDNCIRADVRYYNLPYDCGLSYARNFLVQKAHEAGCNYIFLTADSYEFKDYDFTTIIEFLESNKDNGIIGFVELNKPDPNWKFDLELVPNECFKLIRPRRQIVEFKNLKFQPCDVTQNFFLAKTKTLLDCPWDNELKLTEHEDFFWRLKTETSYKVYFNDSIKCVYINEKPQEYNNKRRRIYTDYKQKLLDKYHLKSWIRVER